MTEEKVCPGCGKPVKTDSHPMIDLNGAWHRPCGEKHQKYLKNWCSNFQKDLAKIEMSKDEMIFTDKFITIVGWLWLIGLIAVLTS